MSQSNNTLYGDLIHGLKEAIAYTKGEIALNKTVICRATLKRCDNILRLSDIKCKECLNREGK